MADTILTRQQVLDTTENVLRRYGPAKANVADVARALGVSPGSIYRHFPTKAALREAVTRGWLDRTHVGLDEIATSDVPAPERLRQWLTASFDAKKKHSHDEPELFDTFRALAAEYGEVATEHIQDLTQQIRTIIRAGVERRDSPTRTSTRQRARSSKRQPRSTIPATPQSGPFLLPENGAARRRRFHLLIGWLCALELDVWSGEAGSPTAYI